jgi:histidinol-phosphate aminotransferase
VPCPDLRLDLERLGAAARASDARMVWVCDPNNPTGFRVEDEEWRALLDAVPPGCLVVADEAYLDYVAPEARPHREQDVADGRRVVVLRTFSKIFGLAGLRLGYALADPALVRLLHSVQEPFNVNRAALAAGLASLGRPADVAARRGLAVAARQRLTAALRAGGVGVLPSAASFILCDLGVDDGELGERLLRRGVLIRTGADMGLAGWARITVGPEPIMDRAAAALLAARDELLAEVATA